MKNLTFVFLLSLFALSLFACSAPAADPSGASSSVAAPAPTDSAPPLPAVAPVPAPKPAEPAVKMVTVPAGTVLEVGLTEALSSSKNEPGDMFMANLEAPVVIGGTTVLEKGLMVHGRVVDAKESGRVKGLASLTLALESFKKDGKTTSFVTKNLVEEAKNSKKRDAGIIGGAAVVGTAIGAIAGGGSGAAKGAAIGGGAGAGTVLVTKGKEVELAPEAKLTFTVDKSFEVAAVAK